MAARFLVIDDHPVTAEGMRQQLEAQGEVCLAGSIREAQALLADISPEVLFVDMSLPDGDGIEFFKDLTSDNPDVRGVLVSGMLSDADIQRAITTGFIGIVTKSSPIELITEALARVSKGESYYSPDVLPVVQSLSGGDLFTQRMLEVLAMLQEGLSNKQIASALAVSEATVSFHITQIKQRLGARTIRQIVAQARKLGISVSDVGG